MATKRAAKRQGGASRSVETPAAETSPRSISSRSDDIAPSPFAAIETHLAALRTDGEAMQRQLAMIGSTLQTAVLADVFALIAQSDAPELSELQRRAQAIQIELTLRRQEVALAEWRRKLEAATQEGERQRQLFARLEADFARRSAQAVEESERTSADFARRSAEFERAIEASRQAEAALRSAMAEQEAGFRGELAAQAASFQAAHAEWEAALAEQAAVSSGREAAFAERERALQAALAEQKAACGAREADLAETVGRLEASVALAEARQQMLVTLERDLDGSRAENATLRDELAALQAIVNDREIVLTEAERRVEELRSSRWRRLGIGLGVARRATFER